MAAYGNLIKSILLINMPNNYCCLFCW